MTLKSNDPKLTAYVLDELSLAQREAVEAQLARSPELRAEVEEIRATIAELETALKTEPAPELDAARRQRVLSAGTKASRPLLRSWKLWVPLAAAATVAIAAGITVAVLAGGPKRSSTEQLAAVSAQDHPRGDIREQLPSGPSSSDINKSSREDKGRAEASANHNPDGHSVIAGQPAPVSSFPPPPPPAVEMGIPGAKPNQAQVVFYNQDHSGEKPNLPFIVSAEPGTNKLIIYDGSHRSTHSVSAGDRTLHELLEYNVAGVLANDTELGEQKRISGFNTEAYDQIVENPFQLVGEYPLSTFSIDVDTASYSNIRRFLTQQGQLPPPGAVRIEEMINYFSYDYAGPTDEHPFAAHVEAASCPWQAGHRLLRVALKGREVPTDQRPSANLVFLLDVSGSMNQPNKLPLVREGMKLLVRQLRQDDQVAIAVYAGASGLVLPSTSCENKDDILQAIDRLTPGGSTNGAAGITLAYQTAMSSFSPEKVNRVILCTDGDFNVGVTNQSELIEMVQEKARGGVFLSVFGFGMGNYKDSTLEKLADKGNGAYGYIDGPDEARKVFVQQISGTLVTIAKDVKIQIEFNPAMVKAYRLIGYENRLLAKEDFNDDTKDAGEIGAGHTVTALYEIVPAGEPVSVPSVDPLKYQKPAEPLAAAMSGEMLTLKLRYKQPQGDVSTLMEVPFKDAGAKFESASVDFRFAAAVASFGMQLRGSSFAGQYSLAAAEELAASSLGDDREGYRGEFVKLVQAARKLKPQE